MAGAGDSLAYQWLRDEVPITGATSATYTFTAAAADDGVVFRAYVVNPGGYAVSAPATLTVTGVPAVLVLDQKGMLQHTMQGMNLTVNLPFNQLEGQVKRLLGVK